MEHHHPAPLRRHPMAELKRLSEILCHAWFYTGASRLYPPSASITAVFRPAQGIRATRFRRRPRSKPDSIRIGRRQALRQPITPYPSEHLLPLSRATPGSRSRLARCRVPSRASNLEPLGRSPRPQPICHVHEILWQAVTTSAAKLTMPRKMPPLSELTSITDRRPGCMERNPQSDRQSSRGTSKATYRRIATTPIRSRAHATRRR